MARIPVPDQINPRAIAGDRLAMQAPDLSAPARALQGLGKALSGLAADYEQNKSKMDQYNTNLALERWSTDQTIQYQNDFDTAAPDGADFIQRREKGLTDSFAKVRAGIKDPELAAKADLVFEQTRGNQLVKGAQDVKKRQTSYVIATTNDSIKSMVESGALENKDQFNDYFENVVRPRIDGVIADPLQRQEAYAVFGTQLWQEYIKRNPEEALPKAERTEVEGGDALSKSASLLRKFEGFRETTYWDVTAHRTGYGSDTITKADGSVVRVQKGMRVSRADAERDLTRRTKEFQKQAASDVGESWGKFNPDQQAALTSVAYNYGSLPKRVINAARTGDPEAVARAVESLADHNAGVNRKRREEEAAVIRGGVSVPGGTSVSYSMPEKPKGGIFEYMDDKSWNDAVKSGQAAFRDSLDLGIEQGEVTRPDIEMAPIEDSDKADLLRRWDKRNEDQGNLAGFVERLGSGGFVNAKDAKDRKAAGMLLDPAAIAASDPDAVAAMYDLYRKSGIVPDNSKGALESMLRSRDASKVSTALSYLDALQRDNPRAFQQEFSEETSTLVADFKRGIDYQTPQQAAEKIMTATDPATEGIRKERGKEAEKTVGKIELSDVKDLFDPSYLPFNEPDMAIAPNAEAELMADYRQLYVDAYKLTGDDAQAKKAAADNLTRVWGVSAANGGRIMKWPPEVLYGPQAMVNGSYDWMRIGIENAMKDEGLVNTIKRTVTVGRGTVMPVEETVVLPYYLVATEKTRASAAAGRPAEYQLWYQDADGNYEIFPREIAFDVKSARDEARPGLERDQELNLERRKRLDDAMKGIPPAGDIPGLGGEMPSMMGGQ